MQRAFQISHMWSFHLLLVREHFDIHSFVSYQTTWTITEHYDFAQLRNEMDSGLQLWECLQRGDPFPPNDCVPAQCPHYISQKVRYDMLSALFACGNPVSVYCTFSEANGASPTICTTTPTPADITTLPGTARNGACPLNCWRGSTPTTTGYRKDSKYPRRWGIEMRHGPPHTLHIGNSQCFSVWLSVSSTSYNVREEVCLISFTFLNGSLVCCVEMC